MSLPSWIIIFTRHVVFFFQLLLVLVCAVCSSMQQQQHKQQQLVGRPLAGPQSGPGRRLAVIRQSLSAPPGSFSSEAAEQQASLDWSELEELEERLMANSHRPGVPAADLTGPQSREGAAAAQEVGRLGLRRLITSQAVGNQTSLR